MGIKLKLEFDCDNAEFGEHQIEYKIASVIRLASVQLMHGNYDKIFTFPIIDINGNKIGVCKTVRTNKTRNKK